MIGLTCVVGVKLVISGPFISTSYETLQNMLVAFIAGNSLRERTVRGDPTGVMREIRGSSLWIERSSN